MDAFRKAARWSFTLWGGRFNPIIPVDNAALAQRLIDLYRVDCLYPATDNAAVREFIKQQRHIPWIDYDFRLVTDHGRSGKVSAMADLLQPISKAYEEHYKHNPQAESVLQIHEWEKDDPLADMFLISFGGLPPAQETAEDYTAMMQRHLKAETVRIIPNQPVPIPIEKRWMLASFNRLGLEQHYTVRNHWAYPGFYVGDASNFDDLMNCWNLRAADVPLVFYDPSHATRLAPFRDKWREHVPQFFRLDDREPSFALWHRRGTEIADRTVFGERITDCQIDEMLWNGLNLQAPFMHFGEAEALASVDTGTEPPSISFSLPENPFKDIGLLQGQDYVVSVDPGIGLFSNEQFTLHLPFLPQLNEFYGRNAIYSWNKARSEPEGLGIINSSRANHLSIRAIEVSRLVTAIFASVGIAASPSAAGLVCTRLMMQMGGLDECRSFRIGGVRDLIERNPPDKSFTRSEAKQTIRGEGTDHPLGSGLIEVTRR